MQEMSVEPDLIHLDRLSRSRCYPNDRIRKQPDFRLAKSVAATEVASMEQTVAAGPAAFVAVFSSILQSFRSTLPRANASLPDIETVGIWRCQQMGDAQVFPPSTGTRQSFPSAA